MQTDIQEMKLADMIAATIFSGTSSIAGITAKLNRLGRPVTESTVRARLADMRSFGLVEPDRGSARYVGYSLTALGDMAAPDITAQLTDDQLELFAPEVA
jgi:hypothetical protein